MAHSSRAVLRSALETLEALLLPARGRHARRRSARVRRYAPLPVPEQAASPVPEPVPESWLAPPTVRTPARDAALVRPYYTAYERELAYTRVHPARRLRARATTPGPRGPRVPAAPYAPTHARPSVPAPRPAGDLLAVPPPPVPGEFDELARLVRLLQDQRAGRRSGAAA
ncbi:hypothetical protein [Nocardiopsis sp. CNT312]|uniref:hypothetical protein n=1 Tax=Nocardiopsis sp. CNT312 TaxID=1137268 RepID=UPI000490A17C|nr:hypothetical protein [Nocardiopsis sp. CNT312]